MSQYTFNGKEAIFRIVVGWDNPLQTFFVQVWDEREEDVKDDGFDEPVLWAGTWFGEIPTLEGLVLLVSQYGDVPEEVRGDLQRDFAERTPPTLFQERLRSLRIVR